MKDYRILLSDWNHEELQLQEYLAHLSGPTDSFWEEKLLKATVYRIEKDREPVGFFSVFQGETLTSFFLHPEYMKDAQEIFLQARKTEFVQRAWVATCDEHFLSLALDCARQMERQAYFFQRVKDVEGTDQLDLTVAAERDLLHVKESSEDFFDDIAGQISRQEIFLAKRKGTLVGFGVMERGAIRREYASIGMYVLPEYRMKGFGTEILKALKAEATKEGLAPIAGCWVWNHGSKRPWNDRVWVH